MKLLLVFVSVLLVGVHGRAVSEDDAVGVVIVPLELSDPVDLDDSTVADATDPQIVLNRAEEIGRSAQLEAAVERAASEGVYIPIFTQACTNSASAFVCGLIGFKNGECAATNLCHCYN